MKILYKLSLVLIITQAMYAQSLEPRLYSNIPIDSNFLLLGSSYSTGALQGNTTLKDPKINIYSTFLAYARGIDIAGKSSKVDLIVPTTCIKGTVLNNGNQVSRDICGFGDIKARLALNIIGAPALKLKNFNSYKPDTIVGVNLQVTAPTGQYDKNKLINIGTNRWALKTGFGVSKSIENFILEFSADAEYFTADKQFILGEKEQDIIYSTQVHIIYTMPKGMWFSINSNYYFGGENTISGVRQHDSLENSRMGLTFSVAVNKDYSLKLDGSRGVLTRTGTDFDTLSIVLQYHFNNN